jgi:ParB family transcriptional regulator, chromosome partitioning protein
MKIVEVEIDSLDLRYAKLRARRPVVEKRLLASLEDAGQQSPVIVVAAKEPGRWVLIEGRKRVRALKRLKADAVKAVVWELAPGEALIAAYQLQDGTGWNVVEEGFLVWELVRGGLSLAEVGRRLKRSKGWVSGRLGLVEGLPERVLEGVLSGKIGAYVATRYLLPFARANAADCEKLAQKIMENEFCTREVELLCQHYAAAGASSKSRIVEEPARFLAALKESEKGALDPKLSEAENRCVNNLELIGKVALGLVRQLPETCTYDTEAEIRLTIERAWGRCSERLGMLAKTAEAVFTVEQTSHAG